MITRIFKEWIFLLFLLFSQQLGAKSVALVIGLGEQLDSRWAKINGDKDVPLVVDYLHKAGYETIHTLVNKEATKEAIVNAFLQLLSEAAEGDRVYIHFSGHGQLVTDVDGDEPDGEWDESWIPYDAYMSYCPEDRGDKHLIDDEVYTLLQPIRDKIGNSGKMLVVVDACHSGDSVRGGNVCVRGIRYEFVIPNVVPEKRTPDPVKWLTLSACKDYEMNQEMEKPRVGKLTYALHILSGNKELDLEHIKSFFKEHPGDLIQTPCLTADTVSYKLSSFF